MTSETPRNESVQQPEQPETEAAPAAKPDAPTGETPSTGDDETARLTSQLGERTADLQRLQAEYVNYKRRVDRDRELVGETATARVLADLLPVLDDIDRARDHGELEGGFKSVAESLERVVESFGLERFGNPGDEFDPRIHEALMHDYADDVDTTTAQTILQVGYRVGERVIRPARVAVVEPMPVDAPVTPDRPAERESEPESPGDPEDDEQQ
ncbi:MAG: nucleotide exchange factor GrpE [Nocardioidaceae bacterium]